MISQYNIDLLKIVLHERHVDLLREAQSERQFRCLNQDNKRVNKLVWRLGHFIPKFNVLRPNAG